MEHNANLAPQSNAEQLPAQVARRIEYARSTGVTLDDGNVIDYLADNMTRATLDELRAALGRTIYAKDFPKAIQARQPTRTVAALVAAEKQLNDLLNGGFDGKGVIPAHYKLTRMEAEAALSLVRLALQDVRGY